ncbi:MAG: hypothetical protein CBC42_02635 [Betaproteobacteria bacterium TMED82]|nr:MAG: hypothetical protein CBC42_02635 [Betaproteobacteria bacterium TMED82]|tara:strand:+ start:36700 stop:37197 length:498 start_codon:yes stop_codon:yes gene_type:complete
MIGSSIKILSCGGTFEKIYDPVSGELSFNNSSIGRILEICRVTIPTKFEQIMLVDSLDMTDKHRKLIVSKVHSDLAPFTIIIHGTDTMIETARAVAKHLPEKKTVVFTGAMIPFTIENSDAVFNFGVSVGALPFLKNGVWISMNGKIFEFDKVRKNKKLGLFEDG